MIILCKAGRAILKSENFDDFRLQSAGIGASGWEITAQKHGGVFRDRETIAEYEDYELAECALRGFFNAIAEKQETYEFPKENLQKQDQPEVL